MMVISCYFHSSPDECAANNRLVRTPVTAHHVS
jgi:hypothetical protein